MPPLLFAANPTVLYAGLILVGLIILLLLVFLVRGALRRRGRLKSSPPDPQFPVAPAAPAQETAEEAGANPPQSEPAGDALPFVQEALIWPRIGRLLLVILAWVVALGFVLVVLPQSSVERLAQVIRLQTAPVSDEESIAFLYLGDELQGKEFHIRGVVRNVSTSPIEKLDAVIRLYAADGTLIETVVVRTDSELIAPDETSSFHLTFPEYSGQFASYSVEFKLRTGGPVPYKDMRGTRDGS